MANPETKLAVLIDADNAQYRTFQALLAEIAKYGTAHVKRAYGDWTEAQLNGWKSQLLKHSIQPIQQFAYTTGKNSTDSALIIDAMDLLYSHQFDGFCLVSSDSDFTRLASRIREAGLLVYGFGHQKTPEAFRVACDRFIFVENISPQDEPKAESSRPQPDSSKAPGQKKQFAKWLGQTVEAVSAEDGWAYLPDVGNHLSQKHPDFDSRTYGCAKLSTLVKTVPGYEVAQFAPKGKGPNTRIRRHKDPAPGITTKVT
ncbi:uncharacterized protein E0L32_003791 [Thyridium curvatum]|uniref:HTH OST-type domain-containing protein n=1 Tax=Thyridium curvatum TaxID=1093900 RepID=A0A507B9H5_9PEZI|nr:uncharacterized protein E0L32_003791 [Thyridium curvatum]TPX16497.1 hypothetical protein E0L32_003791 [Thyridium curvatum]